MDFPAKLRFLREQRGLTQQDFGRLFRLSKQTISAYENGDASPPADTLILMADYFGVTVDFLFGRKTEEEQTGKTENAPLDKLATENRKKVLEYAHLLLNAQEQAIDAEKDSAGLTITDRNGNKPRLKREKRRKTGS